MRICQTKKTRSEGEWKKAVNWLIKDNSLVVEDLPIELKIILFLSKVRPFSTICMKLKWERERERKAKMRSFDLRQPQVKAKWVEFFFLCVGFLSSVFFLADDEMIILKKKPKIFPKDPTFRTFFKSKTPRKLDLNTKVKTLLWNKLDVTEMVFKGEKRALKGSLKKESPETVASQKSWFFARTHHRNVKNN